MEMDKAHELDTLVESGHYTIFATLEELEIKVTDVQLDKLCSVVAALIREAKIA